MSLRDRNIALLGEEEFTAWVRRAKQRDVVIYSQGVTAGRHAGVAMGMSDVGLVCIVQRRSPDGKSFDYIAVRTGKRKD